MCTFKDLEINCFNDVDEEKKEFIIFFKFMINEHSFNKLCEIEKSLTIYNSRDINNFFGEIYLENEEKILMISVFIYKSFSRSNLNKTFKSIDYINSDIILNNVTSYYFKFMGFYAQSNIEINQNFFKKQIFRAIGYMVDQKIIDSKTIRHLNKTVIEWSIKIENYDYDSQLNISTVPFEICEINREKYLKGCFFNKIFKIFNENIKSNEYFQLNDWSYLQSLVNTFVYINKDDFNRVCSVIESYESIKLKDIENELLSLNKLLVTIHENISNNSLKEKNRFILNILNEFESEITEYMSQHFNSYNDYKNFFEKKIVEFVFNQIKTKKNSNFLYLNNHNYEFLKKTIFEIFKNYVDNLKIKKRTTRFKTINEPDTSPLDYVEYNELYVDNGAHITEDDNEAYYEKITEDIDELVDEEFNEEPENIDKTIKENSIILEEVRIYDMFVLLKRKEIIKLIDKNWKNIAKGLEFNSPIETHQTTVTNRKDPYISSTFKYDCMKLISNETYYVKYYIPKKKLNFDLENEMKKTQKQMSKLYILNNLNSLKNLDISETTKIYLPFFFDFRGRFYYNSTISPTTLKYSRYFYYYGVYTESEINEGSDYRISQIIHEYLELINLIKNKFNISRNIVSINEAVFWCLIAIGELTIDKSKVEIKIAEFLNEGIKNIENKPFFNKSIEEIKYLHYTNILTSLNDEVLLKRPVLKDATASFMQNLIRLLGYKNKDSLVYSNLKSENTWYDTYSFILDRWLSTKEAKESNRQILRLFTRKTIKKPVMTNPYSAVYKTAFLYFKEAVEENFNISIEFGSEEEKVFKKFYKFIDTEIEEKFFLKNNSSVITEYIIELIKNQKTAIIKSHDGKTNLVYYTMKQKSWDLIIVIPEKNIKIRKTKKYRILDLDLIDEKKIRMAVRANWVHYIDALLVRDVNRGMGKCYITVHDCFLIDILNVSKFIKIANESTNMKVFEEMKWNSDSDCLFFSIFIFL